MIGISKLYCGAIEASDPLRYGRDIGKLPSHLIQFAKDKRPVVVWNVTRRCNLFCLHCYARSDSKKLEELTTSQGKDLIDDLKDYGVPVLLFSGGEPLLREDIYELIEYASKKGIRTVLSTNGTLIDRDRAKRLKDAGISYVGISIDGGEEIHDEFRGKKGTYKKALLGVSNCKEAGIKVGLRFTIFKRNYKEIPKIFDLVYEMDIDRACFYHLVYAGRGEDLINEDLSHNETRAVVDLIIDKTKELFAKGKPKEILTVDNHADGPYLYLRMVREGSKRAQDVLSLLKMNEGNSSGVGIGCVGWSGDVHPDQFFRHYSFGNVKERRFSEIWEDTSDELMAKLKEKKKYVKGRCAKCRWLSICGGNFRVRAYAKTGDLWAPDPACYLTDKEIGLED